MSVDNFYKNPLEGDFPLQVKPGLPPNIKRVVAEEAYKEYADQFGTQQTLNRLGERGGFGSSELVLLLFERCLRLEAERKRLKRMVDWALKPDTQTKLQADFDDQDRMLKNTGNS